MLFREDSEEVEKMEQASLNTQNDQLTDFVQYARSKDVKGLIILIRDLNTSSQNAWLA